MRIILKPFLSLLLVFCLNGCFSMALPEYFSHFGKPHARTRAVLKRQIALVLVDTEKLYREQKVNKHGSQFVLAAFPLTYLYYPHGKSSATLEIILDRLRYFGFEPIIVPKQQWLAAQEVIQADLVIEPELEYLKINAFDFLFYRKLSVKSSLLLKYYKSPKFFYQNSFDFSDSKYRANASAKALAYYFERTMREAFDREFKKDLDKNIVLSARAKKINFPQTKTEHFFVIQAASLNKADFDLIEQELRDSYGQEGLPTYDFPQFQRIIQRGFEKSLASNRFISLAEAEFLDLSKVSKSSWFVSAVFNKISLVQDQLQIQAKLRLENNLGAKNDFTCSYESSIQSDKAGYLVFAFEEAASKILSSVIENTGEICQLDEI